jgi:ELWxxDGT repeat protein
MTSSSSSIERLESRLLLAAAPAELLGTLPPDASDIGQRLAIDDKLFVSAGRPGYSDRLFVIRGGGDATELLQSATSALTEYRDALYFFAHDPAGAGDGLFTSDGTAAGTRPVKILRPGYNVLPTETFQLNDRFYFFWNELGQPQRLFVSDGTAAGTVPLWTVPNAFAHSISPTIDGHVFFMVEGHLWRTDGTAAGTTLTWSSGDARNTVIDYAVAGDRLFFIISGLSSHDLYVANLDGSDPARLSVPPSGRELVSIGDKIVFLGFDRVANLTALYATDGTETRTVRLAGGKVFNYANEFTEPVAIDGEAVFLQDSMDAKQSGLWATDGTPAGTRRLDPTAADPLHVHLFATGGRAYLRFPGSYGAQYVQTDGQQTRTITFLEPGRSGGGYLGTLDDGRLVAPSLAGGLLHFWALDPDVKTGEITGIGAYDWNRNGLREGFEAHLSGRAYIDLNGNDTLDLDDPWQWASDGNSYLFAGLPAGRRYTVRFEPYGPTPDYPIHSPATGEHQVDLADGQTVTANFASWGTGAVVWGNVFEDLDDDGVQDALESGVGGQRIYLDLNRNGSLDQEEPVRTSAVDGTYGFTDVAAGEYVVRRAPTVGWRQTHPRDHGPVIVTVASEAVAEASFAVVAEPPGSIAGAAWTDWNRDGVRDAGDTPRERVGVYLDLNDSGVRDGNGEWFVVTDDAGRFRFPVLAPGEYVVRMAPGSPERVQTFPPAGQGLRVTLAPGASAWAGEFLLYDTREVAPGGRITGTLWYDRDGNGERGGEDETVLAGRRVYVDADASGSLTPSDPVAITDDAGTYAFTNLYPDRYVLRQELPAGWRQTFPAGDAPAAVTVGAGGQQEASAPFGSALAEPVAGGPYEVAEGASLQLSASPGVPSADPSRFDWSWDLDGDGDFADASGPTPLVTWDRLKSLGIAGGPFATTVRVRMSDGGVHHADSAPVPLAVRDAPPTLTVRGRSEVLAGLPFTLKLGATDPGGDPVAAWRVDWGDGHVTPVSHRRPRASHVYAGAGRTYGITVTAIQVEAEFETATNVRILTPRELVDRLWSYVGDLTSVPQADVQAMQSHLKDAGTALSRERTDSAVTDLQALLSRLDALEDVLADEDEAVIRSGVNDLLSSINAGSAGSSARGASYRPAMRR